MEWIRAIRVHQWLKNFLVFVPLVAAHRIIDYPAAISAALAFVSFSSCASAVYIINDIVDLESDRAHVRKKKRPFASGSLSISHGLYAASLLLITSAIISWRISCMFSGALAGYFCCTCLYSFWLKRQVIVDVMLLASLYTFRILAGAAATAIVPSFWLLAFSMFLFLSLALVKRYSELMLAQQEAREGLPGRGYSTSDHPVLLSLGSAAGYAAVLILALYINSPDVEGLYPNRWSLWLVLPPFLYWMTRIWLKAHRGELEDDPLVFAVTDKQSWAVATLVGLAALFAISNLKFR
jgi:4-hydroxybenzoate polyprenyltransferase